MNETRSNSFRNVIALYGKLKEDGFLESEGETVELGKHKETIKRYIGHIKSLAELEGYRVVYRRSARRYEIIPKEDRVELLWLLSVMLYGSRSLNAADTRQLIDMASERFLPETRRQVDKLLASFHHHHMPMTEHSLLTLLGDLRTGIVDQRVLRIAYADHQDRKKQHDISPYSLAYDQGYFYVVARSLTEPERGVWNFRLDRIRKLTLTKTKFALQQFGPDRFLAGEHANMSYMMHVGDRPLTVVMKMERWLVSYMEDQFPYHEYVKSTGGQDVYRVTVKNEQSILFWVLRQRDWIEVLEPLTLRETIKDILTAALRQYE